MPMPPPRASTEGQRDPHVTHEIGQLTRALAVNGPQPPGALAAMVGAEYWESGRFDAALAFAVSDGVIHRSADGTVATSQPAKA